MPPKPYHPRVQKKTIRDAMQQMLRSKTGHKIGEKTFEKFLRSNEKLKDLTYSGSLEQHEAKTRFRKFVEHVKGNPQMKFKMDAAKRLLYKGQATDTSTKKFYEAVAGEEMKETQASGPTPEQKRAAARRAERLKGYHRYTTLRDRINKKEQYSVDRADHPKTSISEINEPQAQKNGKGAPAKTSSYRPAAISGGAPRVSHPGSNDDLAAFQDVAPRQKTAEKTAKPATNKDVKKDEDDDEDAGIPAEPIDMEIG